MIPVIDLFAGPGGLGEGFSSVKDHLGKAIFRLGQYAKKFKARLPLKYSNHHPLHVSRICRLAIEENIPLK